MTQSAETGAHQHAWRSSTVHLPRGDQAGRRCACGVEVVGNAPFGVNAQVIRASQMVERAMADGLRRLSDAMVRDEVFPPGVPDVSTPDPRDSSPS